MKLGIYAAATGGHVAGWRHPDAYADLGANVQRVAEMAQLAEQGLMDFIFLADSQSPRGDDWEVLSRGSTRYVGQFEPLTLLSALAMATRRIGLVATSSTTYDQPYALARRFASLDLISGGRAGWNLVTSSNEQEAQNFSALAHMEHGDRYKRAREFVDVVCGLWQSWEADAFLRDKQSGRFFDPTGMHLLHHEGENFSVRGPLNVPPSPQGHPVVVQAGASEPGKALAAETADMIFSLLADFDAAKAYYDDVKGRLARHGRGPDDLLILPGVNIFVADTEAEAQAKRDAVQELTDPVVGRSFLEMMLGASLGDAPDDGPLPDLPPTNGNKSMRQKVVDTGRAQNLSIRELYMRMVDKDTFTIIGTPAQVADQMEARVCGGAADGFVIMPSFFPNGLQDVVSLVVPELQRRGLFRTAYEGSTLRGHLGLRKPSRPALPASAA
jgi:FMN-dependent oxidoreductase (nitrilotriacetate monooxygenase family)